MFVVTGKEGWVPQIEWLERMVPVISLLIELNDNFISSYSTGIALTSDANITLQ